MLIVVLDANAVFKDPWLTNPHGEALAQLADKGLCTIVFPEVVIDELRRQKFDTAKSSHGEASKGIEAMRKAGIDVAATSAHLDASYKRIDADLDKSFSALLSRPAIACEPTPPIDVSDLVRRDLERRRPFLEISQGNKRKSLGFRDAVIWETVLAILDPGRSGDDVLFVTADAGFLASKSSTIHPDLLADLDERGIDRNRLITVKNVLNAAAAVEAAAAAVAATARHNSLISAATEALYGLIGREVDSQLTNGGDYDYPEFVAFTVPAIEGTYINEIDQTQEFELADHGDTVTATGEAVIYLEGSLYKGDWYTTEDDAVRVGSELNRHYFHASGEVTVRVIVEIDTSEGRHEVGRIVLRDVPDEGR